MMTKDHANAIMFAYRYDNLTISESLFKQMIGDIAIMRNPWPIFSIAALSGAACLIYDHFFSYETMWIAVVVFLALLLQKLQTHYLEHFYRVLIYRNTRYFLLLKSFPSLLAHFT